MSPKRVEMAFIYKVFVKTNSLFGPEVAIHRTLMARRFKINRTDMVITAQVSRDRLDTIRTLFLADFMLEGWVISTEPHSACSDQLVRHYRGFEVTLYVGPVSRHSSRFDVHGYVRRIVIS